MDDIIGLNIGENTRCPAYSAQEGPCSLPVGHEGAHSAEPGAGVPPDPCPDCGGPMVEFAVDAPTEEIAARVFLAYSATTSIPDELLKQVLADTMHIHIVQGSGADCPNRPEGEPWA